MCSELHFSHVSMYVCMYVEANCNNFVNVEFCFVQYMYTLSLFCLI